MCGRTNNKAAVPPITAAGTPVAPGTRTGTAASRRKEEKKKSQQK